MIDISDVSGLKALFANGVPDRQVSLAEHEKPFYVQLG
jgi:hypothetical protein